MPFSRSHSEGRAQNPVLWHGAVPASHIFGLPVTSCSLFQERDWHPRRARPCFRAVSTPASTSGPRREGVLTSIEEGGLFRLSSFLALPTSLVPLAFLLLLFPDFIHRFLVAPYLTHTVFLGDFDFLCPNLLLRYK